MSTNNGSLQEKESKYRSLKRTNDDDLCLVLGFQKIPKKSNWLTLTRIIYYWPTTQAPTLYAAPILSVFLPVQSLIV